MVRKTAAKTTYKVVQYRGGRVSRRSRLSVAVQLSVPSVLSGSVQEATSSTSPSISVETDYGAHGSTEFQLSDTEEVPAVEIPQFGKQSFVKKCVRQYRQRKEAEIKAWSDVREKLLKKYVESEALPRGTICSYNQCSRIAECRCLDCGILKLMCHECCSNIHRNSLHAPEIWKENRFELLDFERGVWRKTADCEMHGYVQDITVVNSSGIQIRTPVMYYHDEEPCLTLIGYGMWPATPKEPKVAFDMHLMELAEVLFLECRLSTKQFCNALKWMVPDLHQAYVKDIYRLLVGECFSEFRFMRHQFRTLKPLNPELYDNGTTCPACPKEKGTLHISVDALFGCVRKKSSGESFALPNHGETFFVSQKAVDLFTGSYGKQKKRVDNDCNQFQAGTNLRSKTKSNKLDETAVFGCACRHEIPSTFFSLKRGEQISNAVFLLKHIKERNFGCDLKLNFLYDIACTLDSHLKSTGQTCLLEGVRLAIPAFHAYGHKVKCQISYGPRKLEGFGLTDGEVMERLWSYLRPTGKITKEMTATHRIDALTDFLLHYTRRSRCQIGDLLCQRMERTLQVQKCSNEEWKLFIFKLEKDEDVLESDVRIWMDTEKHGFLDAGQTSGANANASYLQYTEKLQEYYSVSLEHSKCVPNSHSSQILLAAVNKLDTLLKKLENGSVRWLGDSPLFLEAKISLEKAKRKEQLEKLHRLVTERWFLLQLMKKYADGQSIAKKLCGQITKQTKAIKNAVKVYNGNAEQWSRISDRQYPDAITFEECVASESKLWNSLENVESNDVPRSVKRHLIDLFHLRQRCEEEVVMLQEEMDNCLTHFSGNLDELKCWLDRLVREDIHDDKRGLIAIVSKRIYALSWFIDTLKQKFNHQENENVIQMDKPDEDITEEAIDEYYSMLNMESMESDDDDNDDDDVREEQEGYYDDEEEKDEPDDDDKIFDI